MGPKGKTFAKGLEKDNPNSVLTKKKKMIGKPKSKLPAQDDNVVSKKDKKPKKAFSNSEKTQGVKRKLEDSQTKDVNTTNQSPVGKKSKKRKLKENEPCLAGGATDVTSSPDKSNSGVDSTAKSTKTSSGITNAGVKNKMNVQPDKNWLALMKILPKDLPKKKEAPKKNVMKKTWRKPRPNQVKKGEVKKGNKPLNVPVKPSDDVATKQILRKDIWFDDVDEMLIEGLQKEENEGTTELENPLVKAHSFEGTTKAVAMDCEMVGVGENGTDSVLARVSIVNRFGHTLLDKYVKPREKVTDFRTHVSGIRPSDLKDAEEFMTVQKEVHNLMKGRILVGHALRNDMQVLFLDHPRRMVRDTAKYKPFRKLFNGKTPSLKNLCKKLLSVEVQAGEHSSVQDAQAAMRIYTMHRKEWEKLFKSKSSENPSSSSKPNPLESDS